MTVRVTYNVTSLRKAFIRWPRLPRVFPTTWTRFHLVTPTCRLNLFASIACTMATGSRRKKRPSLLPAMPLDVLFEVQKKSFYHTHRLSNSSNFPGYSHDEKCHHRLEGCKGVIRGAGVPLEYEQATVGCSFVRELLSGLQTSRFFTVSQYLLRVWMTSIELRGEKHTQAWFCPPASGVHGLQEAQVRLPIHLTFTVDFIFIEFFGRI